jgi:hypothetical protein
VLAICGPARVTEVGGGGRLIFWPVDKAGRAIGPCMFVGLNEYFGMGAAYVGAGATVAGASCFGDWERWRKAGRRDTGDAARAMVMFTPSLLEI